MSSRVQKGRLQSTIGCRGATAIAQRLSTAIVDFSVDDSTLAVGDEGSIGETMETGHEKPMETVRRGEHRWAGTGDSVTIRPIVSPAV